MARKRMVTRTVTGTEAEVKVVVISKDEITKGVLALCEKYPIYAD